MRLFLAIRFDKEMNKTLTALLHTLKTGGVSGNYTPAQNLHITLVFIGEADAEQLKIIKNVIGSIPVPSMRITADKLSRYRDVLVMDVKGNQKLKEYVAQVRKALDAAGIDFDHKKFSPHITLVRKAAGDHKKTETPRASMTCSRVSLMKSVRKDGKMEYTEIAGWQH